MTDLFKFIVAYFLGVALAASCYGQDIKISSVDNLDVGRLKVLEISADKGGVPADSILIDVQGELDYQLFENNSKFVLVPTKVGKIRLKCVAIWFELKLATQTVKEITAGNPASLPEVPDSSGGDFKQLTMAVEILAKQVEDSKGKEALARTYKLLAGAVRDAGVLEQKYFDKDFRYDFAEIAGATDKANQAISRSIGSIKATSVLSDAIDYEALLLGPIGQLAKDFDLTKRATLASFLQAVAEGVK